MLCTEVLGIDQFVHIGPDWALGLDGWVGLVAPSEHSAG